MNNIENKKGPAITAEPNQTKMNSITITPGPGIKTPDLKICRDAALINTDIIKGTCEYARCVTDTDEFIIERHSAPQLPVGGVCYEDLLATARMKMMDDDVPLAALTVPPTLTITHKAHESLHELHYKTLQAGSSKKDDIGDYNDHVSIRCNRSFVSNHQRVQRSQDRKAVAMYGEDAIKNAMSDIFNYSIDTENGPYDTDTYRDLILNYKIESPHLPSYITKQVAMWKTDKPYVRTGSQTNIRNVISISCRGHFDEFCAAILNDNTKDIPEAVRRLADTVLETYYLTGVTPSLVYNTSTGKFQLQYFMASPIYVALPVDILQGDAPQMSVFYKKLGLSYSSAMLGRDKCHIIDLCVEMAQVFNAGAWQCNLRDGNVIAHVIYKDEDIFGSDLRFDLIANVEGKTVTYELVSLDDAANPAVATVLNKLNKSCATRNDVGSYMYKDSLSSPNSDVLIYTPDYIFSTKYAKYISDIVGTVEGEAKPLVIASDDYINTSCYSISATTTLNSQYKKNTPLKRFSITPSVIGRLRKDTVFAIHEFDPIKACSSYKGLPTDYLLFNFDPAALQLKNEYTLKKAYCKYKRLKTGRIFGSNTYRVDYQQCKQYANDAPEYRQSHQTGLSEMLSIRFTSYIYRRIQEGLGKGIKQFLYQKKMPYTYDELNEIVMRDFISNFPRMCSSVFQHVMQRCPLKDMVSTMQHYVKRSLIWSLANRNSAFEKAYADYYLNPIDNETVSRAKSMLDVYTRDLNKIANTMTTYINTAVIDTAGFVLGSIGVYPNYTPITTDNLYPVLKDLSSLRAYQRSAMEHFNAFRSNILIDGNSTLYTFRVPHLIAAIQYMNNIVIDNIANIKADDTARIADTTTSYRSKQTIRKKMRRSAYEYNVCMEAITRCIKTVSREGFPHIHNIEDDSAIGIRYCNEASLLRCIKGFMHDGKRKAWANKLISRSMNGYNLDICDIISLIEDRSSKTAYKQGSLASKVLTSIRYVKGLIDNTLSGGPLRALIPRNMKKRADSTFLDEISENKDAYYIQRLKEILNSDHIAEIGSAAFTCRYFYSMAMAVNKLAGDLTNTTDITPEWQEVLDEATQLSATVTQYCESIKTAVNNAYSITIDQAYIAA